MSIEVPTNSRGPILALTLPASAAAVDVVLTDKTTEKSLTLKLPEGWEGDDLVLDWYRRTIEDGDGEDHSSLIDSDDNLLWVDREPFVTGANDISIAIRGHLDPLITMGESANTRFIALDGTYVYWADISAKQIGRAKLDGTEVKADFITLTAGAYGLAVDATHIYWTYPEPHRIGRAKIDGSEVNQSFISPASGFIADVAVDATYIYWADPEGERIGRAKLDGTEVEAAFVSLTGVTPFGIAVDATHIYWADQSGDRIGRAALGGGSIEAGFVAAAGDAPFAIAVDATHIYWTKADDDALGFASLDGSGIELGASGLSSPELIVPGLAVTATDIYLLKADEFVLYSGLRPGTALAAKAVLHWEQGYY